MRALTVPGYAWSSHPAVLMWQGYEEALGRYGLTMCEVWTELGSADSCATTITADLAAAGVDGIRAYDELLAAGALPPWLFDEEVQRTHRSSLVRKDPDHYRERFPDVPPDLPYQWPLRSPAVVERERRRAENARSREERARLRDGRAGRRTARGDPTAPQRGGPTWLADQEETAARDAGRE